MKHRQRTNIFKSCKRAVMLALVGFFVFAPPGTLAFGVLLGVGLIGSLYTKSCETKNAPRQTNTPTLSKATSTSALSDGRSARVLSLQVTK